MTGGAGQEQVAAFEIPLFLGVAERGCLFFRVGSARFLHAFFTPWKALDGLVEVDLLQRLSKMPSEFFLPPSPSFSASSLPACNGAVRR